MGEGWDGDAGYIFLDCISRAMNESAGGSPAASHFFASPKKANPPRCFLFLFLFFVADISVGNRAARKLALTYN
jgi:hypothetical protein